MQLFSSVSVVCFSLSFMLSANWITFLYPSPSPHVFVLVLYVYKKIFIEYLLCTNKHFTITKQQNKLIGITHEMLWRGLDSRNFGSRTCKIKGRWPSPCQFPPQIINTLCFGSDKSQKSFSAESLYFLIKITLIITYYLYCF